MPRATPLETGNVVDANLSRVPTPLSGVERYPPARRILILEDDPESAHAVAGCLEDNGYVPQICGSGEEALVAARQKLPALALVDVNLVGENGFEIAERFASDRKLEAVPVVFVSGTPELAAHVRRHQRPAWDFLWKPYRMDELIARVERALADAEVRERLRELARVDELTGLANMRMLEERMSVETARVLRYQTPLCLVMADLDGLKRINDQFGHIVGSDVLRAVSASIRGETRETDLAARYGGDEFVILLPHTAPADGILFANRVCERIRGLKPRGVNVSASLGLAAFEPGRDASVAHLLERADEAAYQAKRAGGDRVVVARAPSGRTGGG